MFAIVALIQPLNPATGTRVPVRISSAPGPGFGGVGGQYWEPAITRRPKGSIDLMALDLNPTTLLATCDFEFSLGKIQELDTTGLYWSGAPVQIWRADAYDYSNTTLEFSGTITAATLDLKSDVVTINAAANTKPLEVDLLVNTFTGNNSDGGDPSFGGVLMPMGFGRVLNIAPVFFDTVNNIGMIDGYGNCLGIDWLGEGLAGRGDSVGDYPDYFALKAAILSGAVVPGRWATSLAKGMVGLGAPPVQPITCHATFKINRTGALMQSLIQLAGVDVALIDVTAFNALDAAVNLPIHFWTKDQRQIKDLVEKLASGCNATHMVNFQGKYSVSRARGGAVIGILNRFGYSEPAVTNWKAGDTVVPFWRIRARTSRPGSVLGLDQILYFDNLIPRGRFDITESYRQGNYVTLADQSTWLYINDVPSAGHAPPAAPADHDDFWQQLDPSLDITSLSRPDGGALFTSGGGGTLKMPSVTVDTLDTNTAIIPVRVAATSGIAGTDTLTTDTPTPAQVLTVDIVMSKDGWIECMGGMQVSYAGAAQMQFNIKIDGVQPPEAVGGQGYAVGQSGWVCMGAKFVTAGLHTVTLNWNAYTAATLYQRSLWVKGLPGTE